MFYVATNRGFLLTDHPDPERRFTSNVRLATVYASFDEADTAAKAAQEASYTTPVLIRFYAVLVTA